MTSVVVSDGGGNIVEYVTVVEEPQQVRPYDWKSIKFYVVPTVIGRRTVRVK